LPTYMLLIDYEKAFDRVPRGKLWNIMKNKGFPDHAVKTVQSLYINIGIWLINSITCAKGTGGD
jgi:hypothetical protein